MCSEYVAIEVNNGRTMSGVHVCSEYVAIEVNNGRIGTMQVCRQYLLFISYPYVVIKYTYVTHVCTSLVQEGSNTDHKEGDASVWLLRSINSDE